MGKGTSPTCPAAAALLSTHAQPHDSDRRLPTHSNAVPVPLATHFNPVSAPLPTGGPACTAIPSDCGSGQGSACCPMPYHIAANPTLQRYGCPKDMFCNYTPRPAGSPSTALPSGTCEPNSADCGQFGKRCCVFTGGAATGFRCGAQYGQSGPKGYCSNPPGYTGKGQAPFKDLICTQCPPSEQLDPSLEKTNPELYYSCKTYPPLKP